MASDLDELERLHAAATPGKWEVSADDGIIATSGLSLPASVWGKARNMFAIAATHNALPGLLAELRALREVAEAAREHEEMDQPGMTTLRDHARDALRAALAKVPK